MLNKLNFIAQYYHLTIKITEVIKCPFGWYMGFSEVFFMASHAVDPEEEDYVTVRTLPEVFKDALHQEYVL